MYACRKALEQTGIDPDEALGTMADWHQRYCSYLHNGAPRQVDEEAAVDHAADKTLSSTSTYNASTGSIGQFVDNAAGGAASTGTGYGFSRSNSPDRSRMLKWFGPRGVDLLDWTDKQQALAAFELGVLLLNGGFLAEGGEFLRQAAQRDPRLALRVNLRQGAYLYGKIPKDICRRVAVGYSWQGLDETARQWRRYAQGLDGIPVIGVLSPLGRHAVMDDVLELNPTRMPRWNRIKFNRSISRIARSTPHCLSRSSPCVKSIFSRTCLRRIGRMPLPSIVSTSRSRHLWRSRSSPQISSFDKGVLCFAYVAPEVEGARSHRFLGRLRWGRSGGGWLASHLFTSAMAQVFGLSAR